MNPVSRPAQGPAAKPSFASAGAQAEVLAKGKGRSMDAHERPSFLAAGPPHAAWERGGLASAVYAEDQITLACAVPCSPPTLAD